MDKLDQIPWNQMKAGDVPGLLRKMRTAPPDFSNDEAPLWLLYDALCHQGTVCEASSYAVPFLLELAANPKTPDRVGVLLVLADIAQGESDRKKWGQAAHVAVAGGFDTLVQITKEQGDVALAAAHVLAQFPEHAAKVGRILRRLLAAETRVPQRAGLLLLFGDVGDSSLAARAVLTKGAKSADRSQRQAAAVSIARLKLRPLPPGAREAIGETLSGEESEDFRKLPWDATNPTDNYEAELRSCLSKQDRNALAETLIALVEAGSASKTQAIKLVELLFPPRRKGPSGGLTTQDPSPIQARAATAMVRWMEGGGRLWILFEPARGVPNNLREWRTLATGREPPPIDMSLPMLGHAEDPKKPLRPNRLKVGQRMRHRQLGYGVVVRITREKGVKEMCVDFDEEGPRWLACR